MLLFFFPVVSKASSGALEIFPPFYLRSSSVMEFLETRKERGWRVVTSAAKGGKR